MMTVPPSRRCASSTMPSRTRAALVGLVFVAVSIHLSARWLNRETRLLGAESVGADRTPTC